MYTNTDFNAAMQAYGREITAEAVIGENTYKGDSIVSVHLHYRGKLFSSVMKCCDIELDNVQRISESYVQRVRLGAKTAEMAEYAYRDFGDWVIEKPEYSDENNALKLNCYDRMIQSMVIYDLHLDYKNGISVKSLLEAVCRRFGWTLGTEMFTNADKVIPREPYNNQYTFRDVLDDIAEVAAGTILFKEDGKLYVAYPTVSDTIVAPDNMRSITLNEKYGGINAFVIARTPQEDNIFIRDETSIEENGITEIRFENNAIFEVWRTAAESDSTYTTADDAKAEAFTKMKGLTYYTFSFSTFGYCCFDPLDVLHLQTLDGNQYPVLMLEDDIKITQGIAEECKAERPNAATTEYMAASETDRMVNQTILRVDKNASTIEEIITKTENLQSDSEGVKKTVENVLKRLDDAEKSVLTISSTVRDGVTSVTTETGFTFDRDGLKIEKSGAGTKTQIDEAGISVQNASGGSEDTLLYAGVDSDSGESVVKTKNLSVGKYLVIGGHARFEDYLTNRTGCFYI